MQCPKKDVFVIQVRQPSAGVLQVIINYFCVALAAKFSGQTIRFEAHDESN